MLTIACSVAQAGDFSRHDIDRVALKSGYMHDVVSIARNFFQEWGFCPPGSYIAEQLKLSAQSPELFDGPLRIYNSPSSYGAGEGMTPTERDHYIFYYGDPSGAVSAEIFDSVTGINYSIVTTDEKNMAQSTAISRDHIQYELEIFVHSVQSGSNPATSIEDCLGKLVFGPDEATRVQLENSFRRALQNLVRDIQASNFDLSAYTYELSHLRAAAWEEWGDARNARLQRRLEH